LRPQREEASQSHEHQLLDYVERLNQHRAGRRAVQLHLSRLGLHNRRDHHIRIAFNSFELLVKQYDGALFRLSNKDIMFVCKDAPAAELDEAMMRVRYLFSEDPLTQEDDDRAEEFCTWFDIERGYDAFLAHVRAIDEVETRRQRRLAQAANAIPLVDELPPVDPHRLSELIDTIGSADLSNVMRRQAVFAVVGDQPPTPLFRELFISIAALRTQVFAKYDILGNRWLFQYLTETLDRRMLALLTRNDDGAIAQAFSLNLNISTLLSPEFLAFDNSLRSGARGTLIIELQMIDVFADLGAYMFARDFVHSRGYRVCLDGVTDLTLPFIDREKLGLDLVKLVWSPSMLDNAATGRREALHRLVERTGRARTILCRCDGEAALDFGQAAGIAMYQGRYMDSLTSPKPTVHRLR